MTKTDLEQLVEKLKEQYKDYHSIGNFSVQENEDGCYVSIGLVKVRGSFATTAQYEYLTGLPNTDRQSNGTIRNASKAAVSACITIAKDNPEVEFYFYKY